MEEVVLGLWRRKDVQVRSESQGGEATACFETAEKGAEP